jgi:hypothetical protein
MWPALSSLPVAVAVAELMLPEPVATAVAASEPSTARMQEMEQQTPEAAVEEFVIAEWLAAQAVQELLSFDIQSNRGKYDKK